MENTSNTTIQSADYNTLVKTIQGLQDNKKKLDIFIQFQTKSFADLEQFLYAWNMKYELDGVVGDVNGILGEPNVAENVTQLQGQLNDIKKDVEELEGGIKNLKREYYNLNQCPDRHGKAETAKKVECFLASLPEIHIRQIRQTIDVAIPELIGKMQVVFKAFELENDKQACNMRLADQLLGQIETFRSYADKFNNKSICDSCGTKINKVKEHPSVNPDNDSKTLQGVQKELDVLHDAFENEKKDFEELEEESSDNMEKMWKEDYEDFMQTFETESCFVDSTIEELRSLYERYKEKKTSDINAVKSRFAQTIFARKIDEYFNVDFKKIRNDFSSRNDLSQLEYKIEEYIKERRKKILKVIGIIFAILAGIAIVIRFWQVIVAIIIIVGIIYFIAANKD